MNADNLTLDVRLNASIARIGTTPVLGVLDLGPRQERVVGTLRRHDDLIWVTEGTNFKGKPIWREVCRADHDYRFLPDSGDTIIENITDIECPSCDAIAHEWCYRVRVDPNTRERYRDIRGGLLTCSTRVRLVREHNRRVRTISL